MASEFIIDGIKELEKMAGNYAGARKLMHELLFKACKKYSLESLATSKNKYLNKRSSTTLGHFSGVLSDGITAGVEEKGDDLIVSLGSGKSYARVWEYGRPAGRQPPRAPLVLWARRVMGLSEKEAKSVGYLIARDIGRKGRKARPFLRPALMDNMDNFKEDILTVMTGAAKSGFSRG